jgi:hypothetical protein
MPFQALLVGRDVGRRLPASSLTAIDDDCLAGYQCRIIAC